ncbi:hypothetical protein WJX73_006420 [Symbiochloris irregularis]|uniref:GATA-type domain-containing protein n=1 Tax=Symbiochloris irregularis TaxID=706552 RepID=A0AAW1NVA2_9CHLO
MATLGRWTHDDVGRAVSPSKVQLDHVHEFQARKGPADEGIVVRRCLDIEDTEMDASGLIKAHAGSPALSATPVSPLQQDQQECFLPQASIASEDSQDDSDRRLLRHASTIKPRDRLARKLSGHKSSRTLGASRGSSSSGGSADVARAQERPMADGVMMLLQACEALDMNASRLSGSASASPRRPPRPRNAPATDLQHIRASFSRAFSDSLVPLPTQTSSARRGTMGGYEKENALSMLGPARKSGGHSGTLSPKPPRPIKARKSRSELHGPCCHCMATESPQWRKGPKCKPILCNACGTRFLRTRSLGKSTGKGGPKKMSCSSASSCNLDDDTAAMDVEVVNEELHDTLVNNLSQDVNSAIECIEQHNEDFVNSVDPV